jgi:hypothetical protein
VPDLLCDDNVPLLFLFDSVPLGDADRLLDLLCVRVPSKLVLLPFECMPLVPAAFVRLVACLIRSWQKRNFSSLVIRSNLAVLLVILEVILETIDESKETNQLIMSKKNSC